MSHVRALARQPGFTIIAVLALALGIGATSAIFAAVDAVLLRPLPFPRADRLFVPISENAARQLTNINVTYADYEEWRREARLFAKVALWVPAMADLSGDGEPERVRLTAVTEEFFPLIEVAPIAGRTLLPSDYQPGAPPVIVLAHTLWQQRFGGAADVVGRHVRFDGRSREIVGVLPPGQVWPDNTALFMPIDPAALDEDVRTRRDNMIFGGLARLQEGVSPDAARAHLAAIAARLEREYPEARKGWTNTLVPVREYMIERDLARALYLLLGAVTAVLLIACTNVAGLALVRGSGRARELAVRLALGASRGRLVRQLLAESVVLTGAGAAAGLGLSVLMMQGLIAIAPAGTPFVEHIGLNGRVLIATLFATIVAALVAGVIPALSTSALRVTGALRDGSAGAGTSRRTSWLRYGLVVAQIAAAVVLVSGSALLIRSFDRLSRVDPGVTVERVVSARLAIPGPRYPTAARRTQFTRDLVARLEQAPGIESAALTSFVPAGGGGFSLGRSFLAEGRAEPPAGPDLPALWNVVTPRYFRAIGIPLLEGRAFEDRDTASATPVMIVSRLFARRMFPNESALGKRVRSWRDENVLREIVGVVDDVRYRGLAEPQIQQVYVPYAQDSQFGMMLVARSRSADAGALGATVREAVRAIDPEMAVADLRTLAASANRSIATQRYTTLLLTIIAAVALSLAALGIYGVTSYVFTLRRREMGIRLALGATRADLYRLVFRHGFNMTFAGLALGLAGAVVVTRWLQTLLFETVPTDAAAWTAMIGVVALSTVVACLVPARRAAGADPTIALRSE